MFQLTRQEQLIVVFIMLALIVGAIVRLYKNSPQPKKTVSELTSQSTPH